MGIRTSSNIKVIRRNTPAVSISSAEEETKKITPWDEITKQICREKFNPIREKDHVKIPLRMSKQLQQQLYRNARVIVDNFLELYYEGEDIDSAYDIIFPGDTDHNYVIAINAQGEITLSGMYDDFTLGITLDDKKYYAKLLITRWDQPDFQLSNEFELFQRFILQLFDDPEALKEMG